MTLTKAGIRIEDLHLSFGETKVLEGIDMVIEPGEFFAFLGPSGSGKSTLLRAIAGFGPVPKGRILIADRDIARLPPWKRNVGMVFQSYALWPHMSVRRNVAFGLEERRMPTRQIGPKVERALETVGLLHLADRMPAQLSGGQQQRVALARTIAIEPQVLLLDEPLSNLDAALRVQMRRELLALQRKLGLTTIFVTHDQEEANTTSDRMAVLDKGVIQQIGTPQQLYDHPENAFVAGFLGTANILKGAMQGADFVTEAGQRLPVVAPLEGANRIVLRPQNIRIAASGGEITGKVTHREFLGSQIRYLVETPDGQIIVDTLHSFGLPPYDEGAPVSLSIDSQSAPLLVD
ncbi:iron(III) transport system ATP-binding protein [Paracoccus alcaliphilus]|uniref:Iron(III) transport system ATP-binding protein n=1 Tax=Paracoccus alcaliphilus TaxID=34002 RepID=A0A1H8HUB4_9RHOB|nr:ABC transporter ATP-binding protein [Paracoccus alcaliphilus]WCR19019.1 ABC transporter ATP-binding protein [Paracoccus alcaliphilus]SEN59595.1 iron(III) transport system ATP-binding protein [Paracoccus alcaliphilus]